MDSALSIRSITPILHLRRTSSLSTTSKPSQKPPPLSFPSNLHFTTSKTLLSNPPIGSHITLKASSNSNSTPRASSSPNPIIQTLRTAAAAAILAAAVAAKFHQFPVAQAETTPTISTEEKTDQNQEQKEEKPADLSELLETIPGTVESLKSLLQREMEAGKALEVVKKKLISAGPEGMLSEMLEETLRLNPLDFEALFENALLMDHCGEGDTVVLRLEEALKVAKEGEGDKASEARDVRLIMAQIQFLRKNVEEALRRYEELGREDPSDFRPYFCRGMIYSLLERKEEAREEFAKYRELSPKKVDVEGYLRSPLSRMKVFGTNEEEN